MATKSGRSISRFTCLMFAVALFGVLLAGRSSNTISSAASPWDGAYFPNLPVVTHDGRTLRFYDDLIKDKIVVINFVYTSCANICPLTTARLAEVKDRLGDAVGRDIFFYSITLDPAVDGPEVLAKYAETYRAGPGWLFLTGKPGDIDLIRHKLGERSRSLSEHRNDVMLGNDRTGEWGRDSAFSDIDQLVATIRNMDPKWRDQVHTIISAAPGAKATVIGGTPGQALFIKACAACHTIGQGALVGPDLAGTLERREREWLKHFLMAPDEMRAAKDPVAVALDEKYPGVSMPNLGLSTGDVEDLLSYLAAKSASAEQQTGAQEHASGSAPAQTP
jgi:protein SCO1